jgi:hypothetical protein
MKTLMFGCALVLATSAVAQDAALQNFAGGSRYTSYYGSVTGDVIGWTFTANADVFVTDLGFWIDDQDGVMDAPHQVGIWDINGNLLVSTTVDPNTAFEYNGFNYQSVTPYALSAGTDYVIGGMTTTDDNDWYVSGASSANWDPRVTFVNSRYPLDGEMGFVFPELTSSSIGRFGPNFLLSDIPGPGGLALLGLGLLGYRRRR